MATGGKKWVLGLVLSSLVVQTVKNLPAMQETQEFNSTECRFNHWEKEIATHSSILAWEVPWTEEPGGLQSMGLQKESDTTKRLTLSFSLSFHSRRWQEWGRMLTQGGEERKPVFQERCFIAC